MSFSPYPWQSRCLWWQKGKSWWKRGRREERIENPGRELRRKERRKKGRKEGRSELWETIGGRQRLAKERRSPNTGEERQRGRK